MNDLFTIYEQAPVVNWDRLGGRREGWDLVTQLGQFAAILIETLPLLPVEEEGRLVAQAKGRPLSELLRAYGHLYMEALAVSATVWTHTNVLQHMAGYVSKQLTPEERAELQEVIRDYRRSLVPLVVPLTLIRHCVRKYRVTYLEDQVHLQPHPKELMLRNHV